VSETKYVAICYDCTYPDVIDPGIDTPRVEIFDDATRRNDWMSDHTEATGHRVDAHDDEGEREEDPGAIQEPF
jgi:hypothetical protein